MKGVIMDFTNTLICTLTSYCTRMRKRGFLFLFFLIISLVCNHHIYSMDAGHAMRHSRCPYPLKMPMLNEMPRHANTSVEILLRWFLVSDNCQELKQALYQYPYATYMTDAYGMTLLHYAALHGNVLLCQLLIGSGVYVNQVAKYGCTALHYAVYAGKFDIVKLLLMAGASVAIGECTKMLTPLHLAIIQKNTDVLQLLISTIHDTALLNIADVYGSTPLHWASVCGHLEAARLLIGAGANFEVKDQRNYTPVDLAFEYNQQELKDFFVGIFMQRSEVRIIPTDSIIIYNANVPAETIYAVEPAKMVRIGIPRSPENKCLERGLWDIAINIRKAPFILKVVAHKKLYQWYIMGDDNFQWHDFMLYEQMKARRDGSQEPELQLKLYKELSNGTYTFCTIPLANPSTN